MSLDIRTRRYPGNVRDVTGVRQNGPGLAKRNADGVTSRKDNSEATILQDKYSPEDLFLMLKEYEFKGRLASVGIKGPTDLDLQQESEPSDSSDLSHSPRSNKMGKQDIWTDEAEFAFLAGTSWQTESAVVHRSRLTGITFVISSRTISASRYILQSDFHAKAMWTERNHCTHHNSGPRKIHDQETSVFPPPSSPAAQKDERRG